MRRLELVDRLKWVGYCFFFYCFFRSLHDSLATESDYSGNDGAGKLFWDMKNLSSCCLLVLIKFFSHFISKSQCKLICCPLRDEIKSRKLRMQYRPVGCGITKHYDWFASVNKYLRGKKRRTSLKPTEIWPISDRFLKQKFYCITVHYRTVWVSENHLGQAVETGQQTLGHLELFSDYV